MTIQSLIFAAGQVINTDNVQLPNMVRNSRTLIPERFADILVFVFGLFGAIAVLMIMIASFQYVVSAGDPQKVSKAKDTILYALIGLAVAILAIAILSFGIRGVF